jgi:hypothetical protein
MPAGPASATPAANGTPSSRKIRRRHRRRSRAQPNRKGRAVALTTLSGEIEDAPRILSGISELDRVTGGGFRARFGAAGRRRSGHRQVDAADAGRGGAGRRATGDLCLRRRGRRPGAAAGAAARRRRHRACCSPPKPMSRTSSRRWPRQAPDLVILDSVQTLWTDAAGIGARHRHPGAHRLAGDDALRQADRGRHGPGRPCHQGRPDRRPARGRAHGRCACSISKAKAAITTGSCAR